MHRRNNYIFNFDSESFLRKTETQRLLDIHEHPLEHVTELERRKKMIKEFLEIGKDGYTKSNISGIRASGGGHSDSTCDLAIERTYYKEKIRDDIKLSELIEVENDDIPRAYKACFVLSRSLLLYDRLIELFSEEETKKILRCRLTLESVEEVAEEVEVSTPTVFRKLRKSREDIDDKITELLELYHIEDRADSTEEGGR